MHAAGAGSAERGLPARAARPGARDLRRHHRARRARRAGGRRRDHPGPRLAVDLLAQRPDRAARDPARARAASRRATARARSSTSPAWRSSPAPRSGSSGGWCVATAPAGPAPRCSARSSAASRSGRLRRSELRSRTPMLPMRFFRSRAFSAGNAANFLLFGGALQRRLLHGPVPADSRSASAPLQRRAAARCRGRRRCSSSPRSRARWSTASASGRSSSSGCCCRPLASRWIALIARTGLPFAQMIPPLADRRGRHLDGHPRGPERGRERGGAGRRSARPRAHSARPASSAAYSGSRSASRRSPAPAATRRRPRSATASAPRSASRRRCPWPARSPGWGCRCAPPRRPCPPSRCQRSDPSKGALP